ncbi:MAG: hypothetical protein A3H98_02825 [Bacteroidetes bacterium RIFCSPLOWO2_02_FULL_36_8]|nr:MAG: hypothetical protein A3H98_02825 [Bacteroidetes bacterium RIFCSPLOWO2_02_FULL_36_8]OFY72213.1 MAG: hypothetical protein A3G23_01440 [Bacteroidetes bacterium RIFCSPLOWO2_12_FULL_37_12]
MFVTSCKKDENPTPSVNINFDIIVTNIEYKELWNDGGFVYVTGGVKGIIIYRRNEDEYLAIERNCTYKPQDSCAIAEVDASKQYMNCKCCASRFAWDTSVMKGPATIPLRQYGTKLDGNRLYVYN